MLKPLRHVPGILAAALLACAVLLLALPACGRGAKAQGLAQDPVPVKGRGQLAGYRFTPQETSSIIGNSMHDVHVKKKGMECRRCHQGPEWVTNKQALALCKECHESRTVAADIWYNHCLSCHQFAKYQEHYANSVHVLRELCQDCHGLESVIYTAFDPNSPHDITCNNCHHPHETSLVVGTGVCQKCHKDISKLTDPKNKVHGSCLVCHTPHSPMKKSSELCSKCHYASQDILVHNVPAHPQDCLACHPAHFDQPQVGQKACLVCHDDTYYGGSSNLPKAHRDCNNCHYPSNFIYRGDKACTGCHAETRPVLTSAGLPKEHARCVSCHKPHQWYTSYDATCKKCHKVEQVLEHNLSFHQHKCSACHNPHNITIMAKTGNCSGCHKERQYPVFAANTPEQHLACANCHSQTSIDSRNFTFTGPGDSCMVCHTQSDAASNMDWSKVPSGHKVCNNCHAAHTFETAKQSKACTGCHIDLYANIPPEQHAECFNCHAANHVATFVGYNNSCTTCHADLQQQLATNASHPADCTQCHSVHRGSARDSCIVCHSQLPGLHGKHGTQAACTDCHSTHKFGASLETCKVCHAELSATCTSDKCSDCHKFR